jgi:FecR protein
MSTVAIGNERLPRCSAAQRLLHASCSTDISSRLYLDFTVCCRFKAMNRWILILLLLLGHVATLRAEPFNQAEVTKTINLVSLLPQRTRAVRGDLIKGSMALQTGGNSRAELQFPDLTITRVGSNVLFRFVAGTREIVLDSGTMLFSTPKDAGGGKVQTGAITAAVTGSDFLISNSGRVKVICLSHKITVYFTANPKIRAVLLPGQMLDIAAGADRKMPPVVTINLETLLATSKLGEAGGFGPFPNQTILADNLRKQERGFVPANGPLPANVNLTAQTAQTVRSTEVANNNAPSQSAAQAAQAVPSTAGANNNPGSPSTATPAATGSSPDTSSNGTGGSRGNSNIRDIENRGNSGNAPGRAGR